MRYPPIDNSLFKTNRKNILSALEPNSLLVLHSADPLRLSGDGTLPYRQDSNFFYLTGIEQEESVLMICKSGPDVTEILLLKASSQLKVIWEGIGLSKEEGCKISGIKRVEWLDNYDNILDELLKSVGNVYLDLPPARKDTIYPISRNQRLSSKIKKQARTKKFKPIMPVFTALRMIKSKIELDLIREAGAITKSGFERAIRKIEPGVMEYEIEAEFVAEFVRKGSKGFAYAPIIASGSNACILHYESNNRQCKKGELVLIDVAAEYANYKSDVTRTYPVNGKFSPRQRQVYQAVLDVKNEATRTLKPGMIAKEYRREIELLMEEQLIRLGLFKKEDVQNQNPEQPLFKKYFMHGIAHHLGLDVHDLTDRERPFEEGMVLTIEPGIYIKEEGLGIRLEDDIVIGEHKNEILSEGIPIEIEEVEQLMQSKV